ncbi:MAG: recombinase family protein [Sedimenticola sp.]
MMTMSWDAANICGFAPVMTIVDDLSRLSRAEDMPLLISRIKFFGARVLSFDGFDSDREDSKIQTWIRGLVGNIYLDDLAKKTHRGLKGRALSGHSAGGLSYGYRSIPAYEGKKIIGYKRQIEEQEAKIVRRIFEQYTQGLSPKAIADELNQQGILSPKGSTWACTAIYGHQKKGTGILNNVIYIGQEIWNRSKWIKDPVTGKRKRLERPEEEWVINQSPGLRIVPQELWEAAKKRQQYTAEKMHERKHNKNYGTAGRAGKYILSGLLKCGCCGANYIMVNKAYYGCATRINRGKSVCSNTQLINREVAEEIFLEHIRKDLLSAEAYSFYIAELNRLSKTNCTRTEEFEKDLKIAEKEIFNILEAIKTGNSHPIHQKSSGTG